MARLGFIGLGLMGAPMARNLMRAGHTLVVHNRSQAIVQTLAAEGATAASAPHEVAAQSDVVFTNLPDGPDVEAVLLGPGGLVEGARDGLIVVDHSTIAPDVARRLAATLAERGLAMLDAPVSGGDVGATHATLTIMVGGPASVFDQVLPLLQAMGRTIVHVGDSGAGQIAKVCNQIIVGAQMAALSEALLTAQLAGVDPERVVAAIQHGAARMWALDVKAPALLAGQRAPGFRAAMQAKDLGIVLATGRAYGMPQPLTALVAQLYSAMLAQGHGGLDNSAVISVYEMLANVMLTEPRREAHEPPSPPAPPSSPHTAL